MTWLMRSAAVLPLLLLLLTPLGREIEERVVLRSADLPALVDRRCAVWGISPRAVRCARLYVPEVPGRPDSRVLSLPVVIMRAGGERQPDPVLFIDGGPGGESWATPRHDNDWRWMFEHATWLAGRDVIFFNQRGVAPADKALVCHELAAIDPLVPDVGRLVSGLRSCRTRLQAADVPIEAYSTNAVADDIVDLRRALGHEQWNLWGASYGSRVAQVLMRRDGPALRAVVLDGVYPLSAPDDLQTESSLLGAIDRVFEDCRNDSRCREHYPNSEANLGAVIQALRQNPVTVRLDLPPRLGAPERTVDDRMLIEAIATMMYESWFASYLPRFVAHLQKDYRDAMIGWIVQEAIKASEGSGFQSGMAYSIDCSESGVWPTPQELEALSARYPAYAPWIAWRNRQDVCDAWIRQTFDPLDRTPVRSSVPTVLIEGRYDHATPPGWAGRVAARLDNATLVSLPQSHDASWHGCAVAILERFIAEPERRPDIACARSATPKFRYSD